MVWIVLLYPRYCASPYGVLFLIRARLVISFVSEYFNVPRLWSMSSQRVPNLVTIWKVDLSGMDAIKMSLRTRLITHLGRKFWYGWIRERIKIAF